jgi:hypothetical protein
MDTILWLRLWLRLLLRHKRPREKSLGLFFSPFVGAGGLKKKKLKTEA